MKVTTRARSALICTVGGVLIGQTGLLAGLLIAFGLWLILLATGAYR